MSSDSKPYKVTGVQVLDDHGKLIIRPRLEIRELARKKEQFALFIHALNAIKKPEYRPKAARFQDLGGIHGLPYERWSGDPQVDDTLPKGLWGGYCNHESVLFPSWHRPYVMAIEQSVGEAAMHLADRWTEDYDGLDKDTVRDTWMSAAQDLRFPYWDWTDATTEEDGLPDVLKPQVFRFKMPDGTLSDPIENPLAFHDFGAMQPDGFQDQIFQTPLAGDEATSFFKNWTRTYRWPSSKLHPIEDYVKINNLLVGKPSYGGYADSSSPPNRGSVKQLRARVGNLFCFPRPFWTAPAEYPAIWDEFSNTSFQSKKAGWPGHSIGSVESPHNTVHLVMGGLGAMANNDYAGFDPIFFLHHCNIDRILAFWEHIYNQYWMGDGYYKPKDSDSDPVPFHQPDGTWDEKNNAKVCEDSSLPPFRTGSESCPYWTAKDTRLFSATDSGGDPLWKSSGYTYPDIVVIVNDGKGKIEERRVSLQDKVPETDAEVKVDLDIMQEHFGIKPVTAGVGKQDKNGHTVVSDYRRFYTLVELVGHAFNGSYSLRLLYRGSVIATLDVLSRGAATRCAACRVRRKDGGVVRGVVHIPDDVIDTIAEANKLDASDDAVGVLAGLVKNSLDVQLVDAGGNLLADARGQSGVPGILSTGHNLLEPAIRPAMKLMSSQAIIHAVGKEGDEGGKAPTSDRAPAKSPSHARRNVSGPIPLPAGPVAFFNHADHGDFLGDRDWKTYEASMVFPTD